MQLKVYDPAGAPLGSAELTRDADGRYFVDGSQVASISEQRHLTTLSIADGRTLRIATDEFQRLAHSGHPEKEGI